MRSLSLIVPAALLAACGGDDPVSYSAPVGINLKAKSADTVDGVVSDSKGITTESGNPYGAFVADAEERLGAAPARVSIESVEILLGAESTGVVSLGEIFDGEVAVLFQMTDSDNSFAAAATAMDAETSAGPVDMASSFDSDDLADEDYDKLLGGSFEVVVRGPAAAEFVDKGADADLQITFTFGAYE